MLGKRRQRRLEQQQFFSRIMEEDEEDDDEDVHRHHSDYAKRMIDDDVALGRFLNGASLVVLRGRPNKNFRGTGREREARRGWLRMERGMRAWLRRYSRRDFASVATIETVVLEWISRNDSHVVLRLPTTMVLDRRIAHSVAQFHGCTSHTEANDECVSLSLNRHALLRHDARIADALNLLSHTHFK